MKLLIAEEPLQALPTLAAAIGINEAIVLQQIHYWSLAKFKLGEEPWVYNTQEDWLKQFPWLSLRTLQRVLEKLREGELLFERQPEGTNRRKHYLVNYDSLPKLTDAADLAAWVRDAANVAGSSRQFGGMSIGSTETSTEITPTNPPANSGEQSESSAPSPPAAVRSELTEAIEVVWGHYVETMKPRGRGRELQPDDRKIIRDALKVGDVAELQAAITACEASDWHQKRGEHASRSGGKYRSIAKILKPRPRREETWRSRLEWWLDRAEENAAGEKPKFDVNAEAERMRREQGLDP